MAPSSFVKASNPSIPNLLMTAISAAQEHLVILMGKGNYLKYNYVNLTYHSLGVLRFNVAYIPLRLF